MKIADNLIEIKKLEEQLFHNLENWNNEDCMKRMKVCDRVKLSNKIDSLSYEYSVSLAVKY
jgi:hypothetical protein